MAADRRRGRRITAIAAAAATTALTAALLTGCDSMNKALDCVQTADTIADSVTDLQQAVEKASNDPTRIEAAITSIGNNLDKIHNKTDNVDLDKATQDMRQALAKVQTAVHNGDNTPDISGVTDAAGELTKVCKP
ncbi:hypothetical protein EDD90_6743 [Streptomyces sp. Ag109_O5-1]|uniref:hypothetical protein n=1 Tax=Streptomyces sp. Ag109_O5-1 TaxID=1938851 RepID=UPI000F4EE83B|nr:hypothetical protein [Streptomyces sp. Ag109_O5-1]RPE43539.1 hypothetical protein EDD90_6743 [Streptomyces sp. Ag109_O5-1]